MIYALVFGIFIAIVGAKETSAEVFAIGLLVTIAAGCGIVNPEAFTLASDLLYALLDPVFSMFAS